MLRRCTRTEFWCFELVISTKVGFPWIHFNIHFFYKYTIWCKFTLWELLVLHGTKILWLFSAKRQSGTDSQILIMNLHKAKDLGVNVHNISSLKIQSLHCYFLLLGVSVKTLWKKPCYRELDIESHDRNQMIEQVCAAYFTLWINYGIKTKICWSTWYVIFVYVYVWQDLFTLTVGTFECPQCNIQIAIT